MSGADDVRAAIADQQAREREALEAARRETERLAAPYPEATNPDALVAAGAVLDVNVIARRVVETDMTIEGFTVPVFATIAAAEAMGRAGIRAALAAAWAASQRYQLFRGGPASALDWRGAAFVVGGEPLSYQPFPSTPEGVPAGVIHTMGEAVPVFVPPYGG